jgi:hypothetical protein
MSPRKVPGGMKCEKNTTASGLDRNQLVRLTRQSVLPELLDFRDDAVTFHAAKYYLASIALRVVK